MRYYLFTLQFVDIFSGYLGKVVISNGKFWRKKKIIEEK